MRFRKLLLPLLLLLLLFISTYPAYSQFAGGSGTGDDPYQVNTLEQLQEIRTHTDKHFIQTKDIDASATIGWNDGEGFNPIGDQTFPFIGNFNGDGYIIKNLYIDRNQSYTGLFGVINNALIKNVSLENFEFRTSLYSGGLVGTNKGGMIYNCHVNGAMPQASYRTGGLVGNNDGEVKNSSANVNILSYGTAGGLVGRNSGLIINSHSEGSIENRTNDNAVMGGLVGYSLGEVLRSYSSVSVKGSNKIGGLIGSTGSYSKTENSFATGDVYGENEVGGFVGFLAINALVTSSYSIGKVEGKDDVGGFLGLNGSEDLSSSFWNIETSDQTHGIGRGLSDGAIGLSTTKMTGSSVEASMATLSFGEIWAAVPEGYPKLLWSMPYFDIKTLSSNSPISEGQTLMVELKVKNIGGVPDTQSVVLRHFDGSVIDSYDNLMLEGGHAENIFLQWQTTEGDEAEYELTVEMDQQSKTFDAKVLTLPATVELTEPADEVAGVPIQPEFIWEEASLADMYQFQISDDLEFTSLLYNIDQLELTSFKLPDSLDHLSTYYWRVRGKNESVAGEWSPVGSFTTILGAPGVVMLNEPEDKILEVPIQPEFVWNEVERVETYQVSLAKDSEFKDILFDTSGVQTISLLLDNLNFNATYYWKVRAVNEAGAGEWSEVWSFETKTTTSIFAKEDIPQEVTLTQNYPNPFNPTTIIKFGLPVESVVRLEVYNLLGQRVTQLANEPKSAGWHEVSFDASGLSSGVYLYRLQTAEKIQSRTFTIVK